MQSLGWPMGFEHRGVCFWNGLFCVEYIMLVMPFGCIANFVSLFKRQSSSVESCGWKICVCIFYFLFCLVCTYMFEFLS